MVEDTGTNRYRVDAGHHQKRGSGEECACGVLTEFGCLAGRCPFRSDLKLQKKYHVCWLLF